MADRVRFREACNDLRCGEAGSGRRVGDSLVFWRGWPSLGGRHLLALAAKGRDGLATGGVGGDRRWQDGLSDLARCLRVTLPRKTELTPIFSIFFRREVDGLIG